MNLDNLYKISVITCLILMTTILFLLVLITYFEHKTNVESLESIETFTQWYQDSFEAE